LRSPSPAHSDERRRRFEEIYAKNCTPILGYALRRTDCGENAADVVAETFLIAWRRIDEVPAGEQARLWLYGVARRVLANHHRGERRKSELSERLRGELAVVHRDPEYPGQLADIAAAFRALPGADRELLALVAWEGLGNAEIAAVLGCSANAVRIRLHRARAKFARAVDQHSEQPRSALAQVANGDPA
jgi:RNA polymerase sigma-70 factor (ECF subfamily)